MSAATPTIIHGRYELQRRLAQGGMAEVWLAIDLTLDRRVAVKWLKPTLATDEVVAERFRREAIAAASLSHSNIVAVHDVFEQDGRQAVVMQLVDGKSLRQLLDTQKRLSPELTCHIGIAVASALDHAHRSGFVHRDVKPGNIMITPDGRVLLTDFGIAKGLNGDSTDDLTSDNIMMGTAKYLSPEQVRGKKLDGRADLYSLGLVLYECLAGRVPFLGESDADTALARLQRDPTDLAHLRATLPSHLVGTIHGLLARNPSHRPESGAELATELKQAREEGPPEIDPTDDARSPVAPFSNGKLVRAPSDLRGRARDRIRGTKAPTPPRGKSSKRPNRSRSSPNEHTTGGVPRFPSGPIDRPPAGARALIPGEPVQITGPVPTQTPATSVQRDPTPPTGTPQRGEPARGMKNRTGPPLVVIAVLSMIGLCVVLILWAMLAYGGGNSVTTTTALPADAQAAQEGAEVADETGAAEDLAGATVGDPAVSEQDPATEPPTEPVDPAAVQVTSIGVFDPDGDGTENDELADAARADGDPTTEWRTVCYSGQYMGGKRGVGLVVTLDTPVDRAISVDVTSAPYQIEFFASADPSAPTSFAGWGEPYDSRAATNSGTVVSASPGRPVNHLLIVLNELGANSDCSDDNPYRGSLGELTLVP
jgi:serine/threonine-protein kinase